MNIGPGQPLDRPCDKIKFLKISVVSLHFAMKNRRLACKMSRVSVPKNSGSIAKRVFKKLRDDCVISFSEVVRSATFICQKNERAAGASPINKLWSSLID